MRGCRVAFEVRHSQSGRSVKRGLCCFWHNTDLNLCVLFTPLG
ncbi:hypothetical protein SAMN05445504_5080 [Burkholderia sp. CF099]|nr:hypothetical protein SAMN05445504_5080 [Burkholderia sp. CF099]